MEQRQDGWLFIIGVILGVISNAWISSVFKIVEVRTTMPYNMELDVNYSFVSIAFNILFVVYLTFAGVKFFNVAKWKLIVMDVILLVIPIVYTFPWIILFRTPPPDMSEANILYYVYGAFGFLAGFLVKLFLGIISRHYEEHRDRVLQKRVLRGDLRTRIRKLCDTWRMGEYLSERMDLRKDLVDMVRDIRESLEDEFVELEEEKKTRISTITEVLLKITAEFSDVDDSTWIENVKSEMEKTCKRLEGIAEELT